MPEEQQQQQQQQHPIESLMKTAMETIKQMVDVNTVMRETLYYKGRRDWIPSPG